MKYFILLSLLTTLAFSNIENINSFEADFKQDITNDKGNVLSYEGHIQATKPQFALWDYTNPVNKMIYISEYKVTIIEPEIEQAIVKVISNDFDFFSMIKHAKKIKKDEYSAKFKESLYNIKLSESKIESISYIDEFENRVKILFTNQKQNEKIKQSVFTPIIPQEYDIIRD
ncbi:MAG: LolA-like outer membrane lipoprotein chaperone [Campylobacterota bacterium]|nr:LolA-like outer membrane lipoprotein chaperone [Campylobacterota bacterium]